MNAPSQAVVEFEQFLKELFYLSAQAFRHLIFGHCSNDLRKNVLLVQSKKYVVFRVIFARDTGLRSV